MFRLVVLSLALATAFGAPSYLHDIHGVQHERYDVERKPVYTTSYVDDSIQIHNAEDLHDHGHILGENAHLFTKEQLDNAPIVEAHNFDENGHYIHEHDHQIHHAPADTQHLAAVEIAAPVIPVVSHNVENAHEIPVHSIEDHHVHETPIVHAIDDAHHVPIHSVHTVENHHNLHQVHPTPVHTIHESPVVHTVEDVHQIVVPAVHSLENHHSLHEVHHAPVHTVENVHHIPVHSVHQVVLPSVHAVEDDVHQIAVPAAHSVEGIHSLEVVPLVAPAIHSETSSSVKNFVSGPGVHVASSHSVHEVNKSPSVIGVHSLHAVPVAVSHSSRTDVHKTASIISTPVVGHVLGGAHSW